MTAQAKAYYAKASLMRRLMAELVIDEKERDSSRFPASPRAIILQKTESLAPDEFLGRRQGFAGMKTIKSIGSSSNRTVDRPQLVDCCRNGQELARQRALLLKRKYQQIAFSYKSRVHHYSTPSNTKY
jgi:hypothetical protein